MDVGLRVMEGQRRLRCYERQHTVRCGFRIYIGLVYLTLTTLIRNMLRTATTLVTHQTHSLK